MQQNADPWRRLCHGKPHDWFTRHGSLRRSQGERARRRRPRVLPATIRQNRVLHVCALVRVDFAHMDMIRLNTPGGLALVSMLAVELCIPKRCGWVLVRGVDCGRAIAYWRRSRRFDTAVCRLFFVFGDARCLSSLKREAHLPCLPFPCFTG